MSCSGKIKNVLPTADYMATGEKGGTDVCEIVCLHVCQHIAARLSSCLTLFAAVFFLSHSSFLPPSLPSFFLPLYLRLSVCQFVCLFWLGLWHMLSMWSSCISLGAIKCVCVCLPLFCPISPTISLSLATSLYIYLCSVTVLKAINTLHIRCTQKCCEKRQAHFFFSGCR